MQLWFGLSHGVYGSLLLHTILQRQMKLLANLLFNDAIGEDERSEFRRWNKVMKDLGKRKDWAGWTYSTIYERQVYSQNEKKLVLREGH